MIERAIAAQVAFHWVTAYTVYGVGEVEMALRHAGKGYVLGVKASDVFSSSIGKPPVSGTAEAIAERLAPSAWQRCVDPWPADPTQHQRRRAGVFLHLVSGRNQP
jgi:SRSO17 transposase